jgi:hypothetical protein
MCVCVCVHAYVCVCAHASMCMYVSVCASVYTHLHSQVGLSDAEELKFCGSAGVAWGSFW